MTSAYEILLSAARLLPETDLLAHGVDRPHDETREFLLGNRAALDLARSALGPDCRVPSTWDESLIERRFADLVPLRNLARAFALETEVAELGGDFPAAARIGVDHLELANAVRRGGLVIDLLVAIAFESMGIERLRRIRGHVDSESRGRLIAETQRIDRERERFSEILQRDRDWEAQFGGDKAPLEFVPHVTDPAECGLSVEQQLAVNRLIQAAIEMPEEAQVALKRNQDHHGLALLRLLSIDLALQAFHAEAKAFPQRLTDLAPGILKDVPVDPFTGTAFRYRLIVDRFDLYSPGPAQIDHAGTYGSWPMAQAGLADLCLDSNDYETACCIVARPRRGILHWAAAAIRSVFFGPARRKA